MFGHHKKKSHKNDKSSEHKSHNSITKHLKHFVGGKKKDHPDTVNGHKSKNASPPDGNSDRTTLSSQEDINYPVWYQKQLELPKLKTVKIGIVTSNIKRSSTGDFGFVLRKGNQVEHHSLKTGAIMEKTSIVHFTEPTYMDHGSSLLPGDKLMHVNNVDVQNLTREDIISIIKGCTKDVSLTVQPIGECLEFSYRRISNLSSRFINVRKWVTERGSFNGIYNILYNKIINNIEEIESDDTISFNSSTNSVTFSEKNVWIDFNEGFAGGEIINESSGKCLVRLFSNDNEIEIDEQDIDKANSSNYFIEENMVRLPHINYSSVLYNIMQRFGINLVHTYIGQNLIYLNPMNNINCYSEKSMHLFKSMNPEDLPPHIFSIAQNAYTNLKNQRKSQSICLLGRSGSGKSQVSRHLLNYFSFISHQTNTKLNARKLQAIFDVVNSFTSNRNSMNTNSNRCGKIFTLNYAFVNNCLTLIGLKLKLNFFDKYRIFQRPKREPTFNIFYSFLAGINPTLRAEYKLNYDSETNQYMTAVQRESEKQSAVASWTQLTESVRILEVSNSEWDLVCRLLAAIYHLGMTSVATKQPSQYHSSDKSSILSEDGFKRAAHTLQCPIETLHRSIFEFYKNDSNDGIHFTAADLLNGFVCGLYMQIIDIIVFLINRSINMKTHRNCYSINIIEPPGFQFQNDCSEKYMDNYIDMLYNYSFEYFLHLNIKQLFTNQIDIFQQNGINSNLFQNVPKENGVVKFLNMTHEHGNETGLLNIVENAAIIGDQKTLFKNVEMFVKNHNQRTSKGKVFFDEFNDKSGELKLNHCHHTQSVRYNITNWRKYCRDIPTIYSVPSFLSLCNNEAMQELLTSSSEGHDNSYINYHMTKSILKQFQQEIDQISELFNNTSPSFIYCLSPIPNAGLCQLKETVDTQIYNDNLICGSIFSVPFVKCQLKTYSIIDYLQFFKFGYPEVVSFDNFIEIVRNLVPKQYIEDEQITTDSVKKILEYLKLSCNRLHVGNNQIFFQSGMLFSIKNMKEMASSKFVIRLQACCRSYLAKKKANKLKMENDNIRIIQNNCEIYMKLKTWPWWKLFTHIKPLLSVLQAEDEKNALRNNFIEVETKLKHFEIENISLKDEKNILESQNEKLKRDNLDLRKNVEKLSEKIENDYKKEIQLIQEVDELKVEVRQKEMSMPLLSQNGDHDTIDSNNINRHDELESELENVKSELEKSKTLCQKLRQDKQELDQQVFDLKTKLDDIDMKNKMMELKKEKQMRIEAEEERNKLLLEKDGMRDEINNLESELLSLRSICESNNNNINNSGIGTDQTNSLEMRMSLRNLQEDLDAANDTIDLQNKEMIKLKMKIDRLNKEKMDESNDKENEIEDLRLSYDRKIKNLEMQFEEDSLKRQSLMREKRELERRCAELQEQVEIHMDQSVEKKLRKELKAKTDQLEEALDEIDFLKARKEDRAELKDLRDKNDALQIQIEDLIKKKNYQDLEMEELKSDLDSYKSKFTMLESRNKFLKDELDDKQNSYDDLEGEYENLKRKHNTISIQNTDLQTENCINNEKIEELERDKNKLLLEIDSLKDELSSKSNDQEKLNEINRLKSRTKDLEMALKSEESSKSRHQANTERLKSQIFDLQTEMEAAQSTCTNKEEKNRKLTRQLTEHKNENEDLSQKLIERNIQVQQLNTKINDLEDHVGKLKLDLSTANFKIKQLESAKNDDDSSDGTIQDTLDDASRFINRRRMSCDQILLPQTYSQPSTNFRRNSMFARQSVPLEEASDDDDMSI